MRKLPAGAYLVALICFLLPFVEVSCNGQKVVSLTGIQLLAGTQIGGASPFGAPAQRIRPETSAILAFLGGIAALVLSLMNQRRTDIGAGACGILAAASLLALQQSITSGAPPQAMGMIQVQYQAGYFASVLAFFVGGAAAIYLAFARSATIAVPPTQPLAASPPGNPPVLQAVAASAAALPAPVLTAPPPLPKASIRFCPQCGQQINGDARFCNKCGAGQA